MIWTSEFFTFATVSKNDRATCLFGSAGIRSRTGRAGTQPEGRLTRHSSECAGSLHGSFGIGEVVFGFRHVVRGGAAAVPRISCALRAASISPAGGARVRPNRRVAARGCAAATTWNANEPIVRWQRHDPVQPAAHVVFARRRLSGPATAALRRIIFSQFAGWRMFEVPRAWQRI